MPASNAQKPEVHWDQSAFEAMRAEWTPERIAADEKVLGEIFNLAADVPLLAAALDWADRNGMKIFVDRRAVNCNGYYTLSTGVLGVAASIAANPGDAAGTIVHEIRHAWQDAHGFLLCLGEDAPPGDFSKAFINTALIEADAMAHGDRARDQYRAAKLLKGNREISSRLQRTLADENGDLGEKFLSWFLKLKGNARFYGTYDSKFYGQKWGLYDGIVPDYRCEHKLPYDPELPGLNVDDVHEVLQLGSRFSGAGNYLAALQPDILPKKILRPSEANTFWGAAGPDQLKLTTELRKAYLRKKIADNKKRRSACP